MIKVDDVVTFIPRQGPYKGQKIKATVKDIVDGVAMIVPWNSGHEILRRVSELKLTKEKTLQPYSSHSWESHCFQ